MLQKLLFSIIFVLVMTSAGCTQTETPIVAQKQIITKGHKFYDTKKIEDHNKYKRRRLTVDVDSTGFVMDAWGGECFMKVDLKKSKKVKPKGSTNLLSTATIESESFEMYINENGSFEFDITINEKSADGKYRFGFPFESEELTFYYQPELTEQEKGSPYFMERPDSVVGSYAVYHSSKRDDYIHADGTEERYGTGKVFHIFPAKAWDSFADTVKPKIEIDTLIDSIYVSVDSTWLANAVYPVTIDPEFGNNSSGTSVSSQPAPYNVNAIVGNGYTYTASAGDVVTEIHVHAYTYGGDQTLSVGLYEMGLSNPDDVALTDEVITVTDHASPGSDNSLTGLSFSMTSGTEYAIAYGFGDGTVRISYDSGTKNLSYDDTQPYPATTFDATWNQSGTENILPALWVVYTESSGAVQSPRRRKYLQGDR